ncbi:MAG: slipin family protein, partial [Alphaproteobacteria bacterium]
MEEIIPVLSEIGIFWIIIGIFLLVTILRGFFIILTEYERGVVYVLGRYITTYGPGLRIIVPLLFRVVKVDIR